jgi:RNA polymerase sigma-70 factor (ECF subfamily)
LCRNASRRSSLQPLLLRNAGYGACACPAGHNGHPAFVRPLTGLLAKLDLFRRLSHAAGQQPVGRGYAMIADTGEPSDERLIADARAGQDGAFVQLVSKYKRKVFGLAARFARDGDELDDICQEIFIKIYENLGKFRGDAPFEHWLARITIRSCYDALRSRRKEQRHVPLHNVHNEIEDVAAGSRQAAIQARNLLEWGFARLRPEERLVITLLELEEKSVREIAELTGWSAANVKVRAFRARQKLKRLLERYHER